MIGPEDIARICRTNNKYRKIEEKQDYIKKVFIKESFFHCK